MYYFCTLLSILFVGQVMLQGRRFMGGATVLSAEELIHQKLIV